MATIYELTQDLMSLYEMAEDPDADEDALKDTIEAVEGEFEIKADGYAKVMAQIDGDIASVTAELDRLGARKKQMENSKERIKKALYEAMLATGKTKFKTDLFSFGISKNGGKAPLVIDEGITAGDVPAEYLRFPDPELDKDAIRKALEDGKALGFAHIGERGESLRIK